MPRYQLRNFPDVPFFYAAFSFALLPGEEKRRRKRGREDRTMERKGKREGKGWREGETKIVNRGVVVT